MSDIDESNIIFKFDDNVFLLPSSSSEEEYNSKGWLEDIKGLKLE